MANSFFFYDLETSGINPRRQRIMQFAGQRTDMNLEPIGEPVNVLVRLSDEVLPEPDAVMITGITPQKTLEEGYSEAEFCRLLMDEVMTPGTIMTGFNNVRFDDEFMRFTLYRNFYDPYEWAWSDDRSRWDLLDVVRLTRALRPEGIEWPVDDKGVATNRLELLSAANGLEHTNAHDALSDVEALISVARLIKQKQPKLFSYLLDMRNKKNVMELVNLDDPKPFVYASGRYDSAYEKTTVAFPIAPGTKPGSVLVYDLRHDPEVFAGATPVAMAEALFARREVRQQKDFVALPVKELAYNKCPAVAPLGVLDEAAQQRLQIDLETIKANLAKLAKQPDFGDRVREAFERREAYEPETDVDAQLYDGFIDSQKDKTAMAAVRAADGETLADFHPQFNDDRLEKLLLRYKARNYPASLSADEKQAWEQYRATRFHHDARPFVAAIERLEKTTLGDDNKQFLLSELQLWTESIAPGDSDPA